MKIALGVAALLLIVTLSPGVIAADFQARAGERVVDLQPQSVFASNQTVNLANVSAGGKVDLEKDALRAEFMEPGRYLGPYVRSSQLRFKYDTGGNFSFQSTFNFTREQIMSGAGTWWVRWPVDVSDFKDVCLSISGTFPDAGQDGFARCVRTAPGGEAQFVSSLGLESVTDSTGVYLKERITLLPGRAYTFNVGGNMRPDRTPNLWVTIERYQLEAETSFFFSNAVRGSSHREDLGIYPAFAFNFLAGAAQGGLTAYEIPFSGTNRTFLHYPQPVGFVATTVDDFLSIYMPFTGAQDVTWTVAINAFDFDIILGPSWVNETFTVPATNQFLLVSSPFNVSHFGDLGTEFNVFLYPDKPVSILGYSGREYPRWILHMDDDGQWAMGTALITLPDFQLLQPFINMAWTTGRWAEVTPGAHFATYDFGWGRAYLFPGEVQLVMFLNNGTAIGFDSVAEFTEEPAASRCTGFFNEQSQPFGPIAGWLNKLACFIWGLVGDVVGVLQSAFQAIWGALQQLAEWIYSTLMGFVDFFLKLITAIVEIAGFVVYAMLTAFPFIVILFVASRGLPDIKESAYMVRQQFGEWRSRWRRVGGRLVPKSRQGEDE